MHISGSQVRKYRKAAGIDQGAMAKQLGISGSKLCRIETEDRPFPTELLDKLYLIIEDLNPNSIIALSAARVPEIVAEGKAAEKNRRREERLRNLTQVTSLDDIGKTYRYKDFIVVPTQYYARWSGQETKHVNEAIERLTSQNRLEKDEHFFYLTYEDASNFCEIRSCDLKPSEIKKGLTLITYSAVNRLTHHFQDPYSVARSNYITDTFSNLNPPAGTDGEVIRNFSPREQIINMIALGEQILATDKEVVKLSGLFVEGLDAMRAGKLELEAKIETTDAKIEATDAKLEAKIDATKNELDAKLSKVTVTANGASRIDTDQMQAFKDIFAAKNREYGHGSVWGMLVKDLKKRFALRGDTYKDLASRDFDAALQFCIDWYPNRAQLYAIQGKIAADAEAKEIKKNKKMELFEPKATYVSPVAAKSNSVERTKGGTWTVIN
jgi:transcriptional regulator with XRE-family HTH domain